METSTGAHGSRTNGCFHVAEKRNYLPTDTNAWNLEQVMVDAERAWGEERIGH
jgi:hypothetical protein